MHEPVVHLELNPGGSKNVEERYRLEGGPREQLDADRPRTRVHEIVGVRERVLERRIAPEASAGPSHERARQIVIRPIDRAAGHGLRRCRRRRLRERRLFGVVQILLTQFIPGFIQFGSANGRRNLEPFALVNFIEDHGAHS
jgi:hypothetical protein